MGKQKLSFAEIMKLAEQYGVKENVLFVSAAERYAGQLEMIKKIQADLDDRGLIFEVIGSTGQKKTEAHPLAGQLPKYNDTANKTLGVMLDIIAKLGTAAPAGDKLGEFLSE
jgi:hypothetical protein